MRPMTGADVAAGNPFLKQLPLIVGQLEQLVFAERIEIDEALDVEPHLLLAVYGAMPTECGRQ